jgi:hypothetical protein
MPISKAGAAEAAASALLPKGTYGAFVANAGVTGTKKTGEPMTVLDLEISHKGKVFKLPYYAVHSNWRIANVLEALAVESDPDPVPEGHLCGRRCDVLVTHEEWKGRDGETRTQAKIDKLKRREGGPLDDGASAPERAGGAEDDPPF